MASSSKAEQLRAMREARLSAKSSRGGTEGRAYHEVPKLATSSAGRALRQAERGTQEVRSTPDNQCQQVGIKPGPREAKSSAYERISESLREAVTIAKRGRPRLGEVAPRPWLAAKMSRATWYRRQAELKASSKSIDAASVKFAKALKNLADR